METFDIKIADEKGVGEFFVRPVTNGKETVYQVWHEDNHLFTLEKNIKEGFGYRLTKDFTDRTIDAAIVRKVGECIQKHNERGSTT